MAKRVLVLKGLGRSERYKFHFPSLAFHIRLEVLMWCYRGVCRSSGDDLDRIGNAMDFRNSYHDLVWNCEKGLCVLCCHC